MELFCNWTWTERIFILSQNVFLKCEKIINVNTMYGLLSSKSKIFLNICVTRSVSARIDLYRKVTQQNKISSTQLYFNQTKYQIFNYKCIFDNYPNCILLDWDSIDSLGAAVWKGGSVPFVWSVEHSIDSGLAPGCSRVPNALSSVDIQGVSSR